LINFGQKNDGLTYRSIFFLFVGLSTISDELFETFFATKITKTHFSFVTDSTVYIARGFITYYQTLGLSPALKKALSPSSRQNNQAHKRTKTRAPAKRTISSAPARLVQYTLQRRTRASKRCWSILTVATNAGTTITGRR
jgi:hypothetical protein